MIIKVKEFEDGEIGFDLVDLLEGMTTRLSTVKYYNIDSLDDKSMEITLYNKNKRRIKLKRKK